MEDDIKPRLELMELEFLKEIDSGTTEFSYSITQNPEEAKSIKMLELTGCIEMEFKIEDDIVTFGNIKVKSNGIRVLQANK